MKEAILARLRPEVRAMTAYSVKARSASIKLDQNENTASPPEPIRHAIEDALSQLSVNRYPPIQAVELREALAGLNDWSADGVLVGNGSNELLQMVALSTLGARQKSRPSIPVVCRLRLGDSCPRSPARRGAAPRGSHL